MKFNIASFLSKITLEPTVFALYFGIQLEKGARITTDLLINQVCHYEQNNTQEICASLTNGSFEGREGSGQFFHPWDRFRVFYFRRVGLWVCRFFLGSSSALIFFLKIHINLSSFKTSD